MTDRLAHQFVQSILRQFPDFTYTQAVRLADRLRQEDRAWFVEQVMADIAALPTVRAVRS